MYFAAISLCLTNRLFLSFLGLDLETAINFAERIGFPDSNKEETAHLFMKLYNVFLENDCTLLEINPFTELNDGGGTSGYLFKSVKSLFFVLYYTQRTQSWLKL